MTVNIYFSILFIFWISLIVDPATADRWPGALEEALDEVHDAEIYRAVVDSMRQWELHKKHVHRAKREASRVCYEDVGCFEDTGPFSYLEMLPSPPKDVGTRFFVYGSRKARSVPMEVPADDINEKAHNAIDPELPTKVIVHGFGSGCDHIWVYEMRSALMSVHDCNIVCVDWSPGSVLPNYVRAAANTRLVGRQLAKLIRGLNVPLDKVHLIGFSLGAHVAGFAGAELGNVSRITGLDPAGPLFESQDPRARLDETDANFVDVIHSNGEQLLLGGLGSWQPMGDVDFYPNGGRMQTGCSNLFVGAVSDIIWTGTIEGRSLCNHRRAYKLFTDSVSPKCRFPAFPCEKGYDGLLQGDCFPCGENRPCGDMGYYSDTSNARGQMYLVTREEEPFCAHQYQIKLYNSHSERPTRSYGKLQVTLVGAGGFNETFTMTKKDDEELVVGAVLHKIVVPHPVVINLEAIEVKYTAYSGWISSGLVTWGIDKVSVLDSFGNSLSVCRRGLMLESGHLVHLPLYPGECNIPEDSDAANSTVNSTDPEPSRNSRDSDSVDKKTSGIGPFTKDQNFDPTYDRKDTYDFVPRPSKNIGPFTKDQNIRYYDEKPKDDPKQTIWSFVDLNETGNSLDNSESESGRGFSNPAYIAPSKSSNAVQNRLDSPKPIEGHQEIREPVLQVKKKETGRSMRLPEIKEPILRPKSTGPEETEMKTDESGVEDDSRSFTVQFLPERLAGILAQAERYARQTLLPLISQYTPSFIGNSRKERVKYFPPLSDVTKDTEYEFKEVTKGDAEDDWVPIAYVAPQVEQNESTYRASDNSEGKWINREAKQLSMNNDTQTTPKKGDDWLPITDKPADNLIPSSESDQRKFIPLTDPDATTAPAETTTEAKRGGFRSLEARSMAFPYAYERKADPRTRYIPLIPEEDLGRKDSIFQREE